MRYMINTKQYNHSLNDVWFKFNSQTNKVKEVGIDDDCMKEMNERNEEGGKGDCFDESVSLKKWNDELNELNEFWWMIVGMELWWWVSGLFVVHFWFVFV